MDLLEIDRLLSIPEVVLKRLGQRLHAIGVAAPFLARLARVGDRLDDALRAPLRVWNARRMREPAATVARLFILHDTVTHDEVRTALGDIEPFADGGLIEDSGNGVVSRLHLALAADAYCFGDRPGSHTNAVMPLCGATIDLVRAAMPSRRVDATLDVGCGAGAVGLLLARGSRRVVATDVNPRALAFTRFNMSINAIGNLELRLGNLLEPVRGEHFDRIAAHPPFLARRDGASISSFVHGGMRGDELALRLLAEAMLHLAPAGRALVLADWPLVDGDPLEARVRSALGDGPFDVLVLQSPAKNLDEYCAMHAAIEHADLGAGFADAALAQRDHFEKLRLRGLAMALVVIEPSRYQAACSGLSPGGDQRGWTAFASVRHISDAPITAEAVDRLMATRRLALGESAALGAARLRWPEGTQRVEQPLPNGAPAATVIQLPPGRPEWPVVLDAATAAIVSRIAESPTVHAAIRGNAHDEGTRPDDLRTQVERVARDALLRGALDIA